MTNDIVNPNPRGGFDRRLTSYGDDGLSKFIRRAFLASAGLDAEDLSKPVIGIVNTASDYTTCHRDMPALMDAVKRGVLEAGGLPFQFTAMSLPEILLNPTSMMFRNLMAMEVEEQITSQPMDGVVMLGGCDKTVPAELMAAASANIPAICLVVGPMMTGNWRGERLGACTDCRRLWADYRGGVLDDDQIAEANSQLCPTAGTCMVMGTASTMGCILEALGMTLPFAGTAPAVSSERQRLGVATGRRAVQLVAEDLRPSAILTREAFHNALVTLSAISGSTNAIIHLTAIARRLGITLDIDDFHEVSQRVPVLVDCKPAGSRYLPDMHAAGGMPVLLKELEPLLARGCSHYWWAHFGAAARHVGRGRGLAGCYSHPRRATKAGWSAGSAPRVAVPRRRHHQGRGRLTGAHEAPRQGRRLQWAGRPRSTHRRPKRRHHH